MRLKSARGVCLALVTAALLLFDTSGAQARNGPNADDKAKASRAVQQAADVLETATAKAQAAGIAFAAASQRLPAAHMAVANAQGLVAAAQVRAAAAERTARRANFAFQQAQHRFDQAQADVTAARDELGRYVRGTYEGRPYMMLSALGAGGGPDDLLDRMNYAIQLIGGQRHAVDLVEGRRQIVAQQRAVVAEQKRRADAAQAAARHALSAAAAEQAHAQAAEARVQSLVSQREAAARTAAEEEQASAAQYAEAQAESNRIAQALRAAAHRVRSVRHRRGSQRSHADSSQPEWSGRVTGLRMPVVGWKSSDFGYRFDPYYRRWQLHAGADFAAPEGAPIRAAAAGVVVRAGWNGGYGNYTCIYHYDLPDGQGLSTCYGHQSKILVAIGEHVAQGEVIGRVGTTGASTGDHLHFEVRLDGIPVNPLGWL
jgi:murein DD-endopeptidase MepM/ murein hydrolase activator NlpD